MQQAIKLLQLSSLDLEQEIQEVLDSNIMLEEIDPELNESSQEESSLDLPDETIEGTAGSSGDNIESFESQITSENTDTPIDSGIEDEAVQDATKEVSGESISEDLPVDTTWDDLYDDHIIGSSGEAPISGDNFLETRNSVEVTIKSHLAEQTNLLNLTKPDEYIAESIIDGLDDDGMLQVSVEDICEAAPDEWDIGTEEVEAVLHLIQRLDPVGVASRSLRECLLVQLSQFPPDTPFLKAARILVDQHLAMLASRDYVHLARKLSLKENQLKETIKLIQTLNPKPGSALASSAVDYIEPDVLVTKQGDKWSVELNPKSAPRIRVNPEYVSLIKRGDNSDAANNLKDHLQEARWFIKSLQQRNDTLLRVATKIVEFQLGFFDLGEQAMRPLVLHDIAQAVNLHESTISRVTTQKYMLTPGGIFELKYFFSSHLSTDSGGEVSSTAIRALIKKLVADENPRKPLSDNKIATLLKEQNVKVARRTIAKYRELMHIPPSNERKELI